MQVAVIGCGGWGKHHARVFHELGVLRWVCDLQADVAKQHALSPARPTSNIHDIRNDPETTAVVIATPAVTHAKVVREALQAGKDVFVEKPLALNATEADDLVQMAAQKGRILMVGHLLHYHPAFRTLCDIVSAGELGKLRYLRSHRLNLGKIRTEENALWSLAPHDVSMLLALAGEEPVEIHAQGQRALGQPLHDMASLSLRFASGALGEIFVSWLHPFKEHRLVVVGDNGMAVFDDTLPWEQKLVVRRSPVRKEGKGHVVSAESETIALDSREPLKTEAEHFLRCCQERSTPISDGKEGLRVLRVLEKAQAQLESA